MVTKEVEKRNGNLKQEGITLIALVITIIILLILAGVTINIIINGQLINRATQVADTTKKAQIIERARIDIVEKQTENKGKLKEEELKNILEKYGVLSNNDEEGILNKTLITSEEQYEIKVKDIWNGEFEKGTVTFSMNFYDPLFNYNGKHTVIEGMTWREFLKTLDNLGGEEGSFYADENGRVLYCESYSSTAGYYLIYVKSDKNNYINANDAINEGTYILTVEDGFGTFDTNDLELLTLI